MTGLEELDDVIERHHAALGEIIRGSAEGFRALYARTDDATLANPFGPPARGWSEITRTLEGAAANYRDGELHTFDKVARCVTPALAYTVEMERFAARVGDAGDMRAVTLRVTTIFRPEEGTWRIVHRHADPISAPRSADSVVER